LRIGYRSPKIDVRGKVEDDVGVGARDDASQFGRLNVGPYEGKPARVRFGVAERVLEVRNST
jgi:hypothetical protein